MKRVFLAAVLAASASIASAQNLSDQAITLMAAAQKAVKTYQQGAIAGIYSAVSECYGHQRHGITASDDARAYFAARVDRIRKYTSDAMQLG
jgi:hypothetical protein